MKVAVFGKTYNKDTSKLVVQLLDELVKVSAQVVIEKEFQVFLRNKSEIAEYPSFTMVEGLDSTFDAFISFGGDGTILRAATYVRNLNVPIIGINTGRLGFLSTSVKEDVRKVVRELQKGNYSIVERSLVSIVTNPPIPEFGNLNFGLNEVTVSRKNTTSMITVETYLNDEYLTSYWVDGLIISTPTGSTGYSLSCGGPVIIPTTKSLVITPIAPHNLNSRPLVISDDNIIRLMVSGREKSHLISLDSRIASVKNGQEIIVEKADFTIKMVEYPSESFLKTLRDKLSWGKDRRT